VKVRSRLQDAERRREGRVPRGCAGLLQLPGQLCL